MESNVKIVKGDLVKMHQANLFDYIGHQTNMTVPSEYCTGIARTIFDTYPNTALLNNQIVLGDESELDITQGLYSFNVEDCVINIYGQYKPGAGNDNSEDIDHYRKRFAYLRRALNRLNDTLNGASLGLPLIASGVAKPSKFRGMTDLEYFQKNIQPIIEEELTGVNVTVVDWDPNWRLEDVKED